MFEDWREGAGGGGLCYMCPRASCRDREVNAIDNW